MRSRTSLPGYPYRRPTRRSRRQAASFVVAFAPSVRVAVTWPRPQSDVDNAVVAISDDGILIRAWGCDLDALNSIEEGAAVDFVPCTLPAHAVALCVVARGVIILGRDDVLRLIDRKGRQLDAVSFSCELIASSEIRSMRSKGTSSSRSKLEVQHNASPRSSTRASGSRRSSRKSTL